MTHPPLVPVRDTPLGRGLRELLAKLAARLDLDRKVDVFLAGGMAVHLYLGDRQDIRDLVRAGLTTPDAIEKRAREALVAFVGGQRMAALNLEDAVMAAREAVAPASGRPAG